MWIVRDTTTPFHSAVDEILDLCILRPAVPHAHRTLAAIVHEQVVRARFAPAIRRELADCEACGRPWRQLPPRGVRRSGTTWEEGGGGSKFVAVRLGPQAGDEPHREKAARQAMVESDAVEAPGRGQGGCEGCGQDGAHAQAQGQQVSDLVQHVHCLDGGGKRTQSKTSKTVDKTGPRTESSATCCRRHAQPLRLLRPC